LIQEIGTGAQSTKELIDSLNVTKALMLLT
jgi:hypothetical protein